LKYRPTQNFALGGCASVVAENAQSGEVMGRIRVAAVMRPGCLLWQSVCSVVRSPGIRALPWQNGYAERLIGAIRRECFDHVVVFGERHLRHLLLYYMDYHNTVRTHLSRQKTLLLCALCMRRIQARPVLGGLHRQYIRI
jgi:hypothetical protein